MKGLAILLLALVVNLFMGCSNLRGAKLLLPEYFGLEQVAGNLYLEKGADETAKSRLLDALSQAERRLEAAYGSVRSHPVVHVCVTESCYESFGGMGSKAKVYSDYILLSPRGFNWHYLAHEWSHDEIRTRLTFWAWWRLPQWFDEGLAVAISEAPDHSESHWRSLVVSGVRRPTRAELMTFESLQQWLGAVDRYGETQNAQRRARGESEIRPVYAAAGHEVRPWLAAVGSQGLLELITRLNSGERFEKVYPGVHRARSTEPGSDTVRSEG